MERLESLSLIDQAITLVAPRKSGKTHLISHLLLHTLKQKYNDFDLISIIIYCQSLIDANYFYKLYIYTLLDKLLLKPNNDGINLIENFDLKKHISNKFYHTLVKTESDFNIKTVLSAFIKHLISNNMTCKIDSNYLFPSSFYFNGSINNIIIDKLCKIDIDTNRKRKYIVVIDDVKNESFKDIRANTLYLYEQGRHHDISIIIIDQYVKSKKIPPEVRLTSSHIIFRSFDEIVKKEIYDICAFDKNSVDISTIKDLISDYAAIIIDFNDKTKLYYIRAPLDIFSNIYI